MTRLPSIPRMAGAFCLFFSLTAADGFSAQAAVAGPEAPGVIQNALAPVRDAFQKTLDEQTSRLAARYDDIRKELQEEYQSITRERDEHSQAIFEKVRDLKEKRATADARYRTDYQQFETKMRNANLNASDKSYLDAATPLEREQDSIRNTYDNSLATLQQLYQLNDKRYNELLKIHNARESLEDARYREQRDFLTERSRQERRADRDGATPAQKRERELSARTLDVMEREAKARYENSLKALDQYKSLVNDRIKAQGKYLNDQASLFADISKPDATAAQREKYAVKLAELDERRNLDERLYQNSVRYIEETLAFDQRNGREQASLTEEENEVELEWARVGERFDGQRSEIEARLSAAGITADERKALEARLSSLKEGYKNQETDYKNAIRNISERRDLFESAMSNRRAYLKDRNAIRVRMAKTPMNDDNFDAYRADIGKLEERRIENERVARDKLLSLNDGMPDGFRVTPWQSGNMEARKDRILGRLDEMRKNIESSWAVERDNYQAGLEKLDAMLNDGSYGSADRARFEESRKTLSEELKKSEERYRTNMKALDERRGQEETRLEARARYMTERSGLLNSLTSGSVGYGDVAKYNEALRALDAKWAEKEREYRSDLRPLGSILPTGLDGDGGVESAVDSGPVLRESSSRVIRASDGEGGIWESVKASVSRTYNDAVHYLSE